MRRINPLDGTRFRPTSLKEPTTYVDAGLKKKWGQAMTLMIEDGPGYTVGMRRPITWVNDGGS